MLTNDDLQAIKQIVDDAFEDSDQRTAAGFAEVHDKFDKMNLKIDEVDSRLGTKIDKVDKSLGAKIDEVDNKLSVKDGKLENTVQRVDKNDHEISTIKKKLSLA